MALTPFDWLLAGVVGLSALLGIYRGFVREALALAGWIIAVWTAWQYGEQAAAWLPDFVSDPVLKLWAARLLMLLACLFVVGVVSRVLSLLLNQTGLSGTNRLMGGIFGVARGAILAAVIVAVLKAAGFDADAWWNESKLIPYAAPVADRLDEYAEQGMEMLQSNPTLNQLPELPEGL